MNYYSTREVAVMEGMNKSTVKKWAKANGLLKVDTTYLWTEEDLEKFRDRKKTPGFEAGSRK